MSDSANQIPPHERFGYAVIKRAMKGEALKPWENDYARLFWQFLEIHNGGFEQWIGNTGVAGDLETLEILERYGLTKSHRATKAAFDIVKLGSYITKEPFYNYLEANIEDWFERLRPLNEAFWDDADAVAEKLLEIYNTNTEQTAAGDVGLTPRENPKHSPRTPEP
jgi:hypothetical protein